ncbi:uncharacterized protein LOC135464562 [Liolophura sinensis]|uniref:uncharacterized protein LOC135464562 n=1 Tax=Liolophura sinensis TaxID=3198878 RepID=UPI003159600E
MATAVIQSSSGSQSSGKRQRPERRGRRERCRTQVYEGQYQVEPLQTRQGDTGPADYSQRVFRPRHKSCDPKVDLKMNRRSLPSGTEEFLGSESDSPEEDLRKWARRPRRSRGDTASKANGGGNSSGNQQHRGSFGSASRNLTVPGSSLATQPSSDSAVYTRQRAAQNANSSNSSKSKFQRLEERRRQRLDMAVTSDEEALYDSGSTQSRHSVCSREKGQKVLTNGKVDQSLGQQYNQSQTAYGHSYDPTASSCPVVVNRSSASQNVIDSAEELVTKRPVSLLKAQFEQQMQTSNANVPNSSKVTTATTTNVISSGPVWKPSGQAVPETRRFSADSASGTSVKQPTWQSSKHFHLPSGSLKPTSVPPTVIQSAPPPVQSKKTFISAQPVHPSKGHSHNEADSLDELLESNKDYLGTTGNRDNRSAAVSNIKQTIKTMQQTGKPSGQPGVSNLLISRRTSDPKLKKAPVLEPVQTSTNRSDVKQEGTKPLWPTNILHSLSPKIQNQASVQHGSSFNYDNIASFQQNSVSAQRNPKSPGTDTMEDLWIPRRSEPNANVIKNEQSVNTRAKVIGPKKPERTFVHTTPVMFVTEVPAPLSQTDPAPQGQPVGSNADGMFSDVDYNIEVSERVKKWEFLMHEKNMPVRKDQTPDKVNLIEGDDGTGIKPLSPRSRLPGARLSVIDEKSEAKNMFGYPSTAVSSVQGSGVVTNSGGDLMLSQNQMWTYPGSSPKGSPPKGRVGPRSSGSVRHERQDTLFGDEAWASDWYFRRDAPLSPDQDINTQQDVQSVSVAKTPAKKWGAASYGSSPTMTRKIVYEPLKPEGTGLRLNPFFGPSSDSEITNPLYVPFTKGLETSISPVKATPVKSSRPSHKRQDSDEQIWKEIERMTVYARAIASAATSASQSRSDTLTASQPHKSPTRRSAYEPRMLQKPTSDPFVPLTVDVTSPSKTLRARLNSPFDNVPLVASVKVFQPQVSKKNVTTKSIQYQHIPVADKYQRPEALDEVLEEITTSLEKKPFSPKTKSPGMSGSSQWSTGSPDKPPLTPDVISMSTSQHSYTANDPTAGRPSSMAFPPNQGPYVLQSSKRPSEKQPKFMNLAHGREYQLDHNLLKQKLLGTGLVEYPRMDEDQHTDTGSCKTLDSDSGSQQSLTHVNHAIRELRHLAKDVETKIDMIKTKLVTTKEEDLDTVLMTLRRCSSNLASAKSGYVGNSASAKSRKTKLNDALSELEKIYETLDLNNESLLHEDPRRDYPLPAQGSQWSITSMTDVSSLGSYPQSGSEVHTDTNLSDYNIKWQSPGSGSRMAKREAFYSTDGLERLTQALESSGCDSWPSDNRAHEGDDTPRASNSYGGHASIRDDMAQRKFQSANTRCVGVEMHTPTESLSALSSEESGRRTRSRRKEVDLTEDGSYRKIRTKSATRMDTESPNISPSLASADYLTQRSRSEAKSRMRIRPEKEPDVMHDDMAYRNLRKDVVVEHPKPPPRSSSLHRSEQGKKSDEGSESDFHQLCNAETQTCNQNDAETSGDDDEGSCRGVSRRGRTKDKSHASRKYSKQDQKRRRSLGRGVAKMVERFSSSEDERQHKRPLKHSRSAPNLTEKILYSDTYDSKGEIISTETDTNKEDDAPERSSLRNKNTKSSAGIESSSNSKLAHTKSQTPRTVKQRSEAKNRVRISQNGKNEVSSGKHNILVNGSVNAQNRCILKAKAVEKVSSSDQTPLASSCEGSPAPARLLIHRRTKKVPLATISTTSTSGEESASGSRSSLNQTMSLPQGGVVKRQIPSDLPKGSGGVKMRNKDSNVSKEDREERSKSVPELCARFETDPVRLKSILGTLRKSISAGGVPIEGCNNKTFSSEPNLRDNRVRGKVITKESLLLNWNLKEDTEKEIFC